MRYARRVAEARIVLRTARGARVRGLCGSAGRPPAPVRVRRRGRCGARRVQTSNRAALSCDAGAKGTRWRRGYRRSRASRQSRGACPGAVLSDADAPRRPPPLCFTKPKTPYMSSKVGAGLHEFKALSANSPPRRCWSLTVSWCSHGHGGEEQRTVQQVRDICGISCIQQ